MEILIFSQIEAETAKTVATKLAANPAAHVTVRVNSPGGDCMAGLAIANSLQAHKGRVTIQVQGMCASAATLLCCVAFTTAPANAVFMVHQPWVQLSATANELRKAADALDVMAQSITRMYATKTGKTPAKIKELFAAGDTWFSAEEARAFGLIDHVEEEFRIAACWPSAIGARQIPPNMAVFNHPVWRENPDLYGRCTEVWRSSPGIRQTYKTFTKFAACCIR